MNKSHVSQACATSGSLLGIWLVCGSLRAEPSASTEPNTTAQSSATAEPNTAEYEKAQSWRFALASGYAIPVGKLTDSPGDAMSVAIQSAIPIELSLGRKDGPSYVGGYFGWGIGQIGDAKLPGADMTLDSACGGELTCSQAVVRFGAQWQIHFGKGAASTDPWVGLGVGYEVFSTSFEGPAGDTSLIVHGFELGNLSFGYDVRAGDWLWVGPELRASFGQYSFIDVDCGTAACTASEAISNTALHGWFSAGLRGTFGR